MSLTPSPIRAEQVPRTHKPSYDNDSYGKTMLQLLMLITRFTKPWNVS